MFTCNEAYFSISSRSRSAVLTSRSIAAVLIAELYAWLLGSTPLSFICLHSSQDVAVSFTRLADSMAAQ